MATWNASSSGGITQAEAQAACTAAITAAGLLDAANTAIIVDATLASFNVATSTQVTAASNNILNVLDPPGLTHEIITLTGGDSIIKAGTPGHHLEIYSFTFSSTNTSGGSYTLGYSDNDGSNFVAYAAERRVGSTVSTGLNSIIGQQTSNSTIPQYVIPSGKAFAATSDGEVNVEFTYVDVTD